MGLAFRYALVSDVTKPTHDSSRECFCRKLEGVLVRCKDRVAIDGLNPKPPRQLERAEGERDAARSELGDMGQEIERLRNDRDAHAREVDSLKIRAGQEVASLRSWAEEQVASLRKRAQEEVSGMARSNEMQVASLEKRHAEEVASLRQKFADGLASASAVRAEEVASLDLALEGLRGRLALAEDELENARLQADRFKAEAAEIRGERDRLASAVMQAMDGGGECTRCTWLEGERERGERSVGGLVARLGVAEAMLKVDSLETIRSAAIKAKP